MASDMQSDLFGFLPVKLSVDFGDVSIKPVSKYDDILKAMIKESHQDGFMYPPLSQRWQADPVTLKPIKRIPRTKRPALLYRIPPSHQITFESNYELNELRVGPAGFLIHLLGYLYGVRLQFHDWWVDGRMPMKSQHNITVPNKLAQDFLSHSYATWKNWDQKKRELMTNILFMHTRALSYEWDWERFAIEYMVFDGCCALAKGLFRRLKLSEHEKRLVNICKRFGIPLNKELFNDIVKLRNGLFHKALWGNGQPCTVAKGNAFLTPYHLRRLNQRVIPALLGAHIEYIKTPWWTLGTFAFR
jgi:hypothetical protein